MKKLYFLFFVVFHFFSFAENKAYISSFNVLRLGASKKNYESLANIVKEFDIVGLIEVSNKSGVEKLVDSVEKISGLDWSYHIASYPVGSKKYKEYYGYIFRNDKVKFLKSHGYFKDSENDFIREPYGADFKINNFDFTFILIHSIYGKKKSFRIAEAESLPKVYDYFQKINGDENDIILCGDFNLSVRSPGFYPLLSHEDKISNLISPNLKTTIGKNKLANQYDNIFISKKYTKEFTGLSGTLDFTQNNFELSRKEISDHLPVFIEVDTSIDDD